MPWAVVRGTEGAYEFNADTGEVRNAKTHAPVKERVKKCGSRFFRLSLGGRKRDIAFSSIASEVPAAIGDRSEARKCAMCGRQFEASTPRAKFCSRKCKKRNDNVQYNGFHIKRAREYGVPYERGITLPLVEDKFGGVCQICGRKTDRRILARMPTIDHIVPMKNGGPHTWDNIQLACYGCNSSKAANE